MKTVLISILMAFMFNDSSTMKVILNEMPEHMALEVQGLIVYLDKEKKDIKEMSKTLVDTFDNEYGHKWQSFVGKQLLDTIIDSEPNSKIIVDYNDIQILLFKKDYQVIIKYCW